MPRAHHNVTSRALPRDHTWGHNATSRAPPRNHTPDACARREGTGVCVTGEARSFAIPAVRASLREFLAAVGAVAVRMHIARRASSSMGWTHGHDRALRGNAVRNISFGAEAADVEREFARWHASVVLSVASDCEQPGDRNDECCRVAARRNHTSHATRYPPGAGGLGSCALRARLRAVDQLRLPAVRHVCTVRARARRAVALLGARRPQPPRQPARRSLDPTHDLWMTAQPRTPHMPCFVEPSRAHKIDSPARSFLNASATAEMSLKHASPTRPLNAPAARDESHDKAALIRKGEHGLYAAQPGD
eukprot:5076244-Prymnesium_polylepis.1